MTRQSLTAMFLAWALWQAAFATPYIPDNDRQILERLPATDPASRELRALRKRLDANPEHLKLSLELAERYIERGKVESDPRYYGYAQGLLEPWQDMPEPPTKVLLLRALILQNHHAFDAALHDLDTLLKRQHDDADAWLARAVILMVQARYSEALQSCAALVNFDDTLRAGTCLGQVNSLLGQAQKSYDYLLEALTEAEAPSIQQKQWTLTVLAEIAARRGDNAKADRHFADAVGIGQPNAYLLGAYADFLLDQHQPKRVLALLKNKNRIDALLLRMALAEQQLAGPGLAGMVSELKDRFEAGKRRGENLHQGDEARFALYLLNRPEHAVRLAKANWRAQREPKDARILLEAALAAQQPEAARPVLDLLAATGMEHGQLQRLAAQIGK